MDRPSVPTTTKKSVTLPSGRARSHVPNLIIGVVLLVLLLGGMRFWNELFNLINSSLPSEKAEWQSGLSREEMIDKWLSEQRQDTFGRQIIEDPSLQGALRVKYQTRDEAGNFEPNERVFYFGERGNLIAAEPVIVTDKTVASSAMMSQDPSAAPVVGVAKASAAGSPAKAGTENFGWGERAKKKAAEVRNTQVVSAPVVVTTKQVAAQAPVVIAVPPSRSSEVTSVSSPVAAEAVTKTSPTSAPATTTEAAPATTAAPAAEASSAATSDYFPWGVRANRAPTAAATPVATTPAGTQPAEAPAATTAATGGGSDYFPWGVRAKNKPSGGQ